MMPKGVEHFTRHKILNSRTLALLFSGALAFFFFAAIVVGQTQPTKTPQPPRSPQTEQPTQDPPPPKSSSRTPSSSQKPSPQSPPVEGEDDEVIRVTSNLVVVPVSVTDASGQPVPGLKAADFRLEEEGRAQEIARIGDADQVPLELALLVDVSASVNARFGFEIEAAARFLKTVLKPADRAVLFAIDSTPRLVQARASAETAAEKLKSLQPARSKTAFYDSVVEAARYLISSTPPQHRRAIVVISDGEDTFSERFKVAVAAMPEVQRADAVFYSINPSGQALRLNVISRRGQEGMQKLAEATGGAAFVPEALENLDAVFSQIAAELRSQYLLQYYSNNEARSGKFLSIKVRAATRPELRIRARQGYYKK